MRSAPCRNKNVNTTPGPGFRIGFIAIAALRCRISVIGRGGCFLFGLTRNSTKK
jgi:hypothetical protein